MDASQIIVIEDGTVEVCVVVESPLLPCPITFTFEVIIATSNGTCINIIEHQSNFYNCIQILVFRSEQICGL